MALSPTNNNAALLQEVDEAVRKDQLDTIMQRFGRWIVAGVIAALLAFGGYLYWGHRQEVARGEKAEELLAAFDKVATGQPSAAAAALKTLEGEGDPAYRAAALLEQSNLKAQSGDIKGAAAVIARLKPIVDAKDPASSWFPSAAELSAAAYYQQGKFDEAGKLYGRIAKTPQISKSLQSRAVQMAGMLGVDAVADRAAASIAADAKRVAERVAANRKGTPEAAAAATSEEAK